ncbi:MAG: TonB C-terminal domain-containing protein [Verrucomicrobiota bacterium]
MNRVDQNFGLCLIVVSVVHAVLFVGLFIFFQKNTPMSDPIAVLAPAPELVELQSAHWLETNVDQLSRQAETQQAVKAENEPESEIPLPDTSEQSPESEPPKKVEPKPIPEPEPRKELALERLKPVPKPEPIRPAPKKTIPKPEPTPEPEPVTKPVAKPVLRPIPKPEVDPMPLKPAPTPPKPLPVPEMKPVVKPDPTPPPASTSSPAKVAEGASEPSSGTPGSGGMGTAGGGSGENLNDYHFTVQSAFRSNWFQPRSVLTAGKKYRVKTQIAIARDGRILSTKIVQPSEHPEMNESVAKALAAVRVVPPLPSLIRGDRYDIYLNFDL